jgi:hypothetical protein
MGKINLKLIILLFLLISFFLYTISFKNIKNNILIIASHIKEKYGNKIINNNLKMICDNNNKINLIVIVYSTDNGVLFDDSMKFYKNIPIVYIKDDQNKFYDFYKYKLAYNYVKQNRLTFDWVFVTNDSFIITEDVSWIVNKIVLSKNVNYIGILEANERIFEKENYKKHYQSWWLNFKPDTFDYFNNHIKFNEIHAIKDYDNLRQTIGVKNIINDFEINLSNEMINKFNNKVIFQVNFKGNLFLNDEIFYNYYKNKNFKIVKIKNIKKELLPLNLQNIN